MDNKKIEKKEIVNLLLEDVHSKLPILLPEYLNQMELFKSTTKDLLSLNYLKQVQGLISPEYLNHIKILQEEQEKQSRRRAEEFSKFIKEHEKQEKIRQEAIQKAVKNHLKFNESIKQTISNIYKDSSKSKNLTEDEKKEVMLDSLNKILECVNKYDTENKYGIETRKDISLDEDLKEEIRINTYIIQSILNE